MNRAGDRQCGGRPAVRRRQWRVPLGDIHTLARRVWCAAPGAVGITLGSMAMALSLLGGCDRVRSDEDQPIVITYWTRSWWGDPVQYQGEDPIPVGEWQRRQIARFEREHPHVKVNLQVDPGGRGDKIRLAFAGGVAPDVFHGSPNSEFIRWAELGFLEPIDPYLTPETRADIYPATLKALAYGDKHYGWPLYNHALCLVVNRDLFRERGVTDRLPGPDGDWSMSEFRDLAEQLTFDRDGDGRTDVYGVGLHALDTNHVFLTAYLVNFGARVFAEDGRFILNSAAGHAGLRFLRELIDRQIATPGAAGYNYENMRSLFVSGRVAMYLTSAGTLTWARDQARRGTIESADWTLMPIPHQPDVEQVSYLTVGTVLVSQQSDPAKRDACMALAQYLTGHEVNRHFWQTASPRQSSARSEAPELRLMRNQVARAENFMTPPRSLPARFNLDEELVRLYQDVLAVPPKSTPEAALRDLGERVNRAFAAQEAMR